MIAQIISTAILPVKVSWYSKPSLVLMVKGIDSLNNRATLDNIAGYTAGFALIVFCDISVLEETVRSMFFPCKDVEEANFLVDKDDNFDNEENDLDLDESENVWCTLDEELFPTEAADARFTELVWRD